ncbi:MAG: Pimeloyl-ACP methyl ester carboxylesterase [Frankiales bacterium]|nr:Pimeloyl-ACP methyl ester carboxylesterase [Frankiales bacterium]
MKRAVVLAVAAGAAVAVARRRSSAPEPPATPVAPPLQGRLRTVTTPDGVDLSVEVHGPEDARATVVLAHGYVQSSRLWAGQVRDLVQARPDLRVVVYDHRGHGSSAATGREHAHLEQLGRDLAQVLEEVAPTGPVLLAGHSMGGMTMMALAEERPELFGDRVVGAAFVGTSSGGLDAVTYGLPAPVAKVVKRLLPKVYEKAVRDEAAGKTRPSTAFERRLVFPRGADPEHVREVLAVQAQCTSETMAAFLPTFSTHERAEALAALAQVPAVVLAGDRDVLCPLPHSRAIADALPQGELVVYPGVGHMVQVERREEVSRRLVALADRVVPAGSPVRDAVSA